MSSPEQISIVLLSVASRLHQMGGTIGEDEHGFRALGDQLKELSEQVRQIGVDHQKDRARWWEQEQAITVQIERIRVIAQRWHFIGVCEQLLEVIGERPTTKD